jgi:hypothetical protein
VDLDFGLGLVTAGLTSGTRPLGDDGAGFDAASSANLAARGYGGLGVRFMGGSENAGARRRRSSFETFANALFGLVVL